MTYVTAWPTVDWLNRTRENRSVPARCAVDRPAVPGRTKPDVPAFFLAEALRRAPHLRDITTSTWFATPLGEQCVDVCLRVGNRHVGIQFSRRYEMETCQIDALCLVYGRFDVFLRVDVNAAPSQVQAALAALTGERPGRGVSRMRLCCASDWVHHFEKALGDRCSARRAS